jgi:hypothetical protein
MPGIGDRTDGQSAIRTCNTNPRQMAALAERQMRTLRLILQPIARYFDLYVRQSCRDAFFNGLGAAISVSG